MENFNLMKAATILVTSALVAGAMTFLSPDSIAHATHNLWRCSRCGTQTQTSSNSKPNPGTCAYSNNGHNWQLVP